jgi:sulfur dioxygenase
MNNLNLPNPSMMDVAISSNLNLGKSFTEQKLNKRIKPDKFNAVKKDD